MTEQADPPPISGNSLTLKLPESDVALETPWQDDALGRIKVAEGLTNLVRHQSASFVIGIHGYWGTGKTFLLKRWQTQLQKEGFEAIYFNAWEDDFCDDPLLAILGQLSDHFKDQGLSSMVREVFESAVPLLKENLHSILQRHTGITLRVSPEEQTVDFLDLYLNQRATKDELRASLANLSTKVGDDTGHPLIFIIDELDRCRPTFAIELLERVKHVFEVPNLVFVFGINRDELCASFQSVYGQINAEIYLRRFFDIEFTLPLADAEHFATHLIQRYHLEEFFANLDKQNRTTIHHQELSILSHAFPKLCSRLDLSLRDMDYCVRIMVVLATNLQPTHRFYPWLLGLLIPLKLVNPQLYRQFIDGVCHGSEVMDYIHGLVGEIEPDDYDVARVFDLAEAYAYCAAPRQAQNIALEQLQQLAEGKSPVHPEYLSKKTLSSDANRAAELARMMSSDGAWGAPNDLARYLGNLIDLQHNLVRR